MLSEHAGVRQAVVALVVNSQHDCDGHHINCKTHKVEQQQIRSVCCHILGASGRRKTRRNRNKHCGEKKSQRHLV